VADSNEALSEEHMAVVGQSRRGNLDGGDCGGASAATDGPKGDGADTGSKSEPAEATKAIEPPSA